MLYQILQFTQPIYCKKKKEVSKLHEFCFDSFIYSLFLLNMSYYQGLDS